MQTIIITLTAIIAFSYAIETTSFCIESSSTNQVGGDPIGQTMPPPSN